MKLTYWSRANHDVEFDAGRGVGTIVQLASPRPEAAPCSGYAGIERRLFGKRLAFAIYRSRDDIYFNAGRKRWLVGDPRVTIEHDRPMPFVSRLRIFEGGSVAFSFKYQHLGRSLFALADPTYDKIDQEHDFFLEFVAVQSRSREWIDNVRRLWTEAA